MSLVPVDTTNALAVSDYLSRAKDWLATAVEMTGPVEIAAARAEIATAAEAAKQLNLSKDIRDDATEMVRRAEYAVSRAIRKGQEDGTVRTRGQRATTREPYTRTRFGEVETVQADRANSAINLLSPSEVAPDLSANGGEIRQLGSIEPDVFEEVLEEAKAEGNLSRRNVAQKVINRTKPPSAVPTTRETRADLIEDLAAQGYSSRQMPAKVGVTEETVRQIARDFDIEIPADRSVNRTRRMDSTRIVTQTATALEGLAMGIDLIDYAALDPEEVGQWIDSLTTSVNALSKALKKIKESIQ